MSLTETNLPAVRDGAKAELLASAITVFGRDGFHAASTRAIADAAGVNISQISYYFGGKEGLYLAVFAEIAAYMQQRLGPVALPIITRLAGDVPPDPEWAAGAACQIAAEMVRVLLSEDSAPWARLIVREQQDPSKAFDTLYDGFMGRVFNALLTLTKLARGGDDLECRVIAVGIVGHAITFRSARAAVCRVFGQETFDAADVAAIQNVVRRNVRGMLLQDAPIGPAQSAATEPGAST